ncbi:thiamine pyrophosphate-binding protein [Serratia sp. NA_13]|uniref:thiamine pyrophosphate-binding protein n=1 Tax=Serratia sp. NA_13 TaxID=3415658 RepID=UPI004046F95A
MNKVIAGNDVSIGYQLLLETLSKWGVTRYVGVTGGGVVHFLKHINPLVNFCSEESGFLSIAEYSAGFIPLGYYLSSGRMAAAVATTGAASKLLSCGISDAKLHDIPAIYIVPLTGEEIQGHSPLQDTSESGSNLVAQLRSELPESVFVLDSPETLAEKLSSAQVQLERAKPVVLEEKNYHANLKPLDYCAIARACGWEAEQLAPDLSNLSILLDKATGNTMKSLLIDIPVDASQVLGRNPRVKNL